MIRWGLLLFGFFALAGSATLVFAYFTVSIPDPNQFTTGQATIIQYADGSEIGRLGAQNRVSVPLAKMPIELRRAVLAAENKSFYTDHAVSPTGILRAVYYNLRGGSLQGGSTITQQYAKTAFLTPERTIKRKLKELVISIKLENTLSKDEILENYLNTIYFGRGAYGVEAAARQYFGRDVDQLTLAQSAVLASVLRSPGFYDPQYSEGNKKRLDARFSYVIKNMVESKWISPEKAAKVKLPTIKDPITGGEFAGPTGYLLMTIKSELAKLGFTEDQLLVSGLRVKTTFERAAQQAAVDAVDTQAPKKAPADLHIGLASVRPGTGEVVAMYGGKDYLVRQLNDATQGITMAGSTFKPFALIAGLEAGIGLDTIWNGDSPQIYEADGKPYEVGNYGNKSFGDITLLQATASSVNTVYVPLGLQVGAEKVVEVARRAGIPTSVEMMPTPSVVLGSASPHVLDVAAAYATFAAQGVYAKPYFISTVSGRNGGILFEAKPQGEQVFSADVMADVTTALQAVVKVGSGFEAKKLKRPAAGKTGTSQENASAWFSGFTPQLATSVSFYRDDATQTLRGIGGLNSVTGGSFPARIWTQYMIGALKGQPILKFPSPANITGTEPVLPKMFGVSETDTVVSTEAGL
ncbi:MAG: penicillin-binding protein [Actinobacteria bacterium]|nr:penicillin-binding protein [Actinomycetota bacterium]MSY27800.1 penicillin-binding protein [Actinomycetota bacterium]MSZ86443.1 penicillin-binding protein [Actinomycetota bacterium]MTB24842.1 penicillin-binding protein [Actinomycetota bacterium]